MLPACPAFPPRFSASSGSNLQTLSTSFLSCRGTRLTGSVISLDTGSTDVGSSFSSFVAILALFGLAEGRSVPICDCDAGSGGVMSAIFLTDGLEGALRCSKSRSPSDKGEFSHTYL